MNEKLNPAYWVIDWDAALVAGVTVGVAVVAAYLAYRIVFAIVGRITSMSETEIDDLLLRRIRQPVKWSFFAIAVTLAAELYGTRPPAERLRPRKLQAAMTGQAVLGRRTRDEGRTGPRWRRRIADATAPNLRPPCR